MRLDELARQIDATVSGDGSIEITEVAPLEEASSGSVSFLANARYQKQLETTNASAVITASNVVSLLSLRSRRLPGKRRRTSLSRR